MAGDNDDKDNEPNPKPPTEGAGTGTGAGDKSPPKIAPTVTLGAESRTDGDVSRVVTSSAVEFVARRTFCCQQKVSAQFRKQKGDSAERRIFLLTAENSSKTPGRQRK